MKLIATTIAVLCTFAAFASASSERTESIEYTLLVSNLDPECGGFTPTDSPVCFSILPGETHFVVSIQEESPTATSGFPISGRITFIGAHFPHVYFCGQMDGGIIPGATHLLVEVHTRPLGSFCDPLVGPSPAAQGTVTATFT